MKNLFATIAFAMVITSSSFANTGPCSKQAAAAAVKYASHYWATETKAPTVKFSEIMPSSNPAPVQMYDVGLQRQSDKRLVQFDVALDYVGGKCQRFEVRFAEYAE